MQLQSTTNSLDGLDFGFAFEQLQMGGEFTPATGEVQDQHAKAQIVPQFFTGGKAAGQCIVSAAVTASEFTGYPEDTGYFNMSFYNPVMPTLPPVDLSTLTVGDLGNLGSDGNVYKNEPQGATVSIAVTGPIPNFAYTVAPVAHVPVIWANTSNLSITNPTFCVGQQIGFSLVFSPDLAYVNALTHWSFPGKYVNHSWQQEKWIPGSSFGVGGYNLPYGSVNYDINPDYLTNMTTTNWYVKDPGGVVSVGTSLLFSDGQTAGVAALGNVTIYRPSVQFTPGVQGPVVCTNGWLEMLASFSATVTSTLPGEANWTQLINMRVSSDDTTYWIFDNTMGSYWLDTEQFYNTIDQDQPGSPPTNTPVGPGNDGLILFADYPGVQCGWVYSPCATTIVDDFETYLIFRPSSGIWVTLGVVNWGWYGTAFPYPYLSFNPIWRLIDGGVSPTEEYTDTDQFPVWTYTFVGKHSHGEHSQ